MTKTEIDRWVLGILAAGLLLIGAPVHAAKLTIAIESSALMLNADGEYTNRILYKFNLPPALAGCRIDRAMLKFPLAADVSEAVFPLRVWPVGVTWTASGVAVSNADLQVVDTVSVLKFSREVSQGLTSIDITKLVSRWRDGSVPNRGLVIEQLHGGSEALEVTASDALPADTRAVVDVWYTNKPRQE